MMHEPVPWVPVKGGPHSAKPLAGVSVRLGPFIRSAGVSCSKRVTIEDWDGDGAIPPARRSLAELERIVGATLYIIPETYGLKRLLCCRPLKYSSGWMSWWEGWAAKP